MNEKELWEQIKKCCEEYAQKYMCPHDTIVITQEGISLYRGEKASPFKILD